MFISNKMEAMVISCALCGCSGAHIRTLYALPSAKYVYMVKSDELVIMVILGGRGSLTGTILAGLMLSADLPELLMGGGGGAFGCCKQWRSGALMEYLCSSMVLSLFRPYSAIVGTYGA